MQTTISLKSIKQSTVKTIKKEPMEEILEHIKDIEIDLWGVEQPKDYRSKNVYICIYRYIHKIGYLNLWKQISSWYKNSHESLMHNCQIILTELGKWGRSWILLGELSEWKEAAKGVRIPKGINPVNLWMDSSDFALKGKSKKLRKNELWSYKLNSLGNRYQFVFDANLKALAIWGGYSPKISDSQWVVSHKEELSEIFNGATIIADCGYYSSRNTVEGVTFETPIPGTVKVKEKTNRNYAHLTSKQNTKNKQIRNLRARVENPFGQIKNKFKSLGTTFMENSKLLDSLVIFAFAIYNKSL